MNEGSQHQEDLLRKVDTWVESSGRALELRTARTLKLAGANVVQVSRRYEGTTTGQRREMDVYAAFTWRAAPGVDAQLRVSVECKSSNEKPWVAFRDEWKTLPSELFESSFVFKNGSYTGLTEPLAELWRGLPPFLPSYAMTHIVTADLGARKPSDGRNTAHDAVRQAMSGASALRSEYLASQSSHQKRAHLVVATVVTVAPLFACHLDAAGHVVTQPVDSLAVWEPRHDGRSTLVFVLSENAFQDFASDLAHCRDVAAASASANV